MLDGSLGEVKSEFDPSSSSSSSSSPQKRKLSSASSPDVGISGEGAADSSGYERGTVDAGDTGASDRDGTHV